MARRIRVLPDAVANQIAAGEVVERPASVVKELVENALDARATSVDVEVERGGKRRLRVSDNGVGMSREDAILCFDRHATSKIGRADDLRDVRSFGFRGEALPSIAAVSRLTLETRAADEEVGTVVRLEGGAISGVDDRARRRGTSVEVRNLFFNAPARAKFLRAVGVETRAVSDGLAALALANPRVGFTLVSDDRPLLELAPDGDVAGRVAEIWGDEAAATLLPVAAASDGFEVRGLVQRPDAAGPGLRRGYLFVNGRPFRDPALIQAADRGYRTTIPSGARPWLFLYLDVPAGAVDVNVHPAKAEVRFRDTAAVEALVESALREALGGEASSATLDRQPRPPRMAVRERPEAGEAREPRSTEGADPAGGTGQMALFLSGLGDSEGDRGPDGSGTTGAEGTWSGASPEGGGEAAPRPPEWARLWQLLDTYILVESRDGVLIIDQHSAHERVLFERLMDAFGAGGQEGQRLLFPLTLRLPSPEYELVLDMDGLFAQAGFEIEGFGGDTVIVHSVPDPHPWFDAERCLREMVAELTQGSELIRSAGNQHERIAMTFACKGAVKAGQRLSEPEMQELLDALFATELPHHDVHGRPTVVRLSAGELERKFGRH